MSEGTKNTHKRPYTQTIAALNLAIFLSCACVCVKKCVTLQADCSVATVYILTFV